MMGRNPCILWCSQRDSDPEEYPTALLDPSTCAHELLHRIYTLIVRTPTLTPTDRKLRDAEIYRRYQQGESTASLADAFGFSVKHIRHIVRVAKQQEANHEQLH